MLSVLASASLAVMIGLRLSPVAQGPDPLASLDAAALGTGPYGCMHMLLERTIFRVDVLTVDVRVDEETRRELDRIARTASRLDERAAAIANVVVDARQVLVTLEFKRRVSFNAWLGGARDNLQKALRANLIEDETFRYVSDGLPQWFDAIASRGFDSGDRIIYRGYPTSLRTLAVSADGEILVDQTADGPTPHRTMLAGYFAPGTEFREALVESLSAC
jgi:hypothetical protein